MFRYIEGYLACSDFAAWPSRVIAPKGGAVFGAWRDGRYRKRCLDRTIPTRRGRAAVAQSQSERAYSLRAVQSYLQGERTTSFETDSFPFEPPLPKPSSSQNLYVDLMHLAKVIEGLLANVDYPIPTPRFPAVHRVHGESGCLHRNASEAPMYGKE
jgi:hypothetical protein